MQYGYRLYPYHLIELKELNSQEVGFSFIWSDTPKKPVVLKECRDEIISWKQFCEEINREKERFLLDVAEKTRYWKQDITVKVKEWIEGGNLNY